MSFLTDKSYPVQQIQSYILGFTRKGNTALVEYVYLAHLALCNTFSAFPGWLLLCQSPENEGW